MEAGASKVSTNLQVVQINKVVQIWPTLPQLSREDIPILAEDEQENHVSTVGARSALIERCLQAAKSQPEIRAARVEALQASIEAGTYRLDSSAIAQKILKITPEEGVSYACFTTQSW